MGSWGWEHTLKGKLAANVCAMGEDMNLTVRDMSFDCDGKFFHFILVCNEELEQRTSSKPALAMSATCPLTSWGNKSANAVAIAPPCGC